MSYLFIKNLFQREKFVLFSKKFFKKNQKTQKKQFYWFFLVVFWAFLGGFFIANPA